MIDGEQSSVLKTPSSKRLQDQRDEAPELNSTTKKLCSKAVKIEKIGKR